MSDHQQGPGWWLASDGRWYPPEGAPPVPPPHIWAPGPPPGPPPKRGMSTGAVVALVLGCVLGVLVLAAVAVSVLGTDAEPTASELGNSDITEERSGTSTPAPDVPEGFELMEGDGVAMATPAGWELIDAADVAMGGEQFSQAFPDAPPEMVEQGMNMFEQGAVLVAFDFSDPAFASNVNVIKIPGEAPLGLIKDQAAQQLATLGGEVIETGRVDVAIGEALRIEYTLDVASPDGSSVPARGVQFYVPAGGSTYIVTVTMGSGSAALADQLIETFQVR